MFIDLAKMSDEGFTVKLNRSQDRIEIYPNDHATASKELQKAIREVGAIMGFDERETDDLFGAAHKIQVVSAIRKCSNW